MKRTGLNIIFMIINVEAGTGFRKAQAMLLMLMVK
jgi:hypothetical protein